MSHDIIGDVHGHADRLEALLKELGYAHRNGAWRPPNRTVIFVGDFIDRGPGQLRTLRLVRAMMEAASARAVMGNHEFNAIAWSSPDPLNNGLHLRLRHGDKGEKNRRQHEASQKSRPTVQSIAPGLNGSFSYRCGLKTPNFRSSMPAGAPSTSICFGHTCRMESA